jgi:hypothetical protein
VLFTTSELGAAIPGHTGFIAGRYRNGACSDVWTDVRRCASRTFTHYLPACTCGWTGVPVGADEVGWMRCQRALRHQHLDRWDGPGSDCIPAMRQARSG